MPQKCTVLYIILLTRILAMKIWTIGSLIILHPVIIFILRVIRHGAPLANSRVDWAGVLARLRLAVASCTHYRHVWTTCVQPIWICVFVALSLQANLKYLLQLDTWSSLRQLSINLQRQAIPVCRIMHVLPSIMILFLDTSRAKSPILQVLIRTWPVCGWCHIYIMIWECIYQHHLLTSICYCWSLTISSFSKVTAAAWHRRFLAQSCMSVLGEKLIAFLSWIIYLAVFKTCASLAQEVFYNTKVAHLKAACRCRDHGGGRSSSFR